MKKARKRQATGRKAAKERPAGDRQVSRDSRNSRDGRDSSDSSDSSDSRESRDSRNSRDDRDGRDSRDSRESRNSSDSWDSENRENSGRNRAAGKDDPTVREKGRRPDTGGARCGLLEAALYRALRLG